MSWTIRLSKGAAKHLKRLPRDQRDRLREALEEMEADPFMGDVRPIKSGRFRGALRKRVGRYRLVFFLDPPERRVEIAAVLPRSEKTYR
jgi:mRNA-degrading endonuclease RelE of RelBE toxin-antitoxin system